MQLSDSLEEYLRTIYVLNKENQGVRLTDIANTMKVQKSSTNQALHTLKEEGMIYYEKYKNITLTPMGITRAKNIEKRHHLFKTFLTEIIQTDEMLAEEEAEKLAHCVSCHTTAKLENFIEQIVTENRKKKEEIE